MKTYTIVQPATGVELGTYVASSEANALLMLAKDAGYDSIAAMDEASGDDSSELQVLDTEVLIHGETVNFDAARNIMDDEICEELISTDVFDTYQEFVDIYLSAHNKKYGSEFSFN